MPERVLEPEPADIEESQLTSGDVEQRLAPIRDTLASLQFQVAVVQRSLKRMSRRRGAWIRRNGTYVLAALSAGCALLAWLQPQWSQRPSRAWLAYVDRAVDRKIAGSASQLTAQAQSLQELRGSVDEMSRFIEILARRKLEASTRVSPQVFQNDLMEIRGALEVAKEEHAMVGEDVISAIRRQLLDADPGSRHYWPAMAAFVSFRSPRLPPNLPPCEFGSPTISRCTVLLDGKSVARVAFQWARIVYRGGPIAIGPSVSFADCEFDIRLSAEPPAISRILTRALLTASSPQVVHLN